MRRLATFLMFVCMAGVQPAANAAGLQVAPVSLTLAPARQAAALWLSNTGDQPMDVQARVFAWTQHEGEETLTASSGLVVSPPMARLAPGQRQLVRVVRTGPPPSGPQAVQQAYRLMIDELPPAGPVQPGFNFVMRYSVPVFVDPAGGAAVEPALQWSVVSVPGGNRLQVRNDGRGHAQLADLAFVAEDGERVVVQSGLMGYVLPGAQREWAFSPKPSSSAGKWEVMINGQRKGVDIEGV